MLELLALGLVAVAVICVLQLLAEKTGLPAAALLTVAGLIYALLPGPNLTLEPELILTLVIPPLIYTAALNASLLAIRKQPPYRDQPVHRAGAGHLAADRRGPGPGRARGRAGGRGRAGRRGLPHRPGGGAGRRAAGSACRPG